ncbi:MAG: hypothetical protein F7C33_05390 [Desulfurococcales archaeon]|nr:hypothetical protein [Desulfurococcales archaeon]
MESEADRKMWILAEVFARVPRGKKRQAYRVYLDLARGKISYEEALERLRRMAEG